MTESGKHRAAQSAMSAGHTGSKMNAPGRGLMGVDPSNDFSSHEVELVGHRGPPPAIAQPAQPFRSAVCSRAQLLAQGRYEVDPSAQIR